MLRFPHGRVQELKDIADEAKKEAAHHKKEKEHFIKVDLDLCNRFQLASGYKREMESLAEKIVTSTIPTIEENKRMKHLIIELFVRLGHD